MPEYRSKAIVLDPKCHDNRDKARTDYTCYVCGRDINAKKDHFTIHVIHGGCDVLWPSEVDEKAFAANSDNLRGDLGENPVGPTCVKKAGLVGWATKVGPLDPAHYDGYGIPK